jgi:3-hydroxyisobutyrate dehydrogenase-like beta-hydroxyacid dehydrogenase
MIFAAIEAIAEATALIRIYGVSTARFTDLMTSMLFSSPIYRELRSGRSRKRAARGRHLDELQGRGLAFAAGGTANVPLPLASPIRSSPLEAIASADEAL